MKLIATILISLMATISHAEDFNLGHRLGASAVKYLPENSLQVLNSVLPDIQFHKDFVYIEFDVRESSTGELVVFHDPTFKRMINKKNSSRIKNTSFNDIRSYCLKGSPKNRCYQVPTPNEVLQQLVIRGFKKPVMIDIKHISEKGKKNLLEVSDKYKNHLLINFIIAQKTYKKLFSKDWCREFNNQGFYVMETKKEKNPQSNNLCGKMSNTIKSASKMLPIDPLNINNADTF